MAWMWPSPLPYTTEAMLFNCRTVVAKRDYHGNVVSNACDTLAVACQPREVHVIPICASFPEGKSSTNVRIFAHSAKPASKGDDFAAMKLK